MAKRTKYKLGDVFLIELENGLKTVGRIIKKSSSAVFLIVYKINPVKSKCEIKLNELEKEEDLFMQWCYDTALKNGMWEIISNIPVEEDFEMPYFSTDDGNGKYYLIKGGDKFTGVGHPIEVSKEEAMKAYSWGIANEYSLPTKCMYLYKKINIL